MTSPDRYAVVGFPVAHSWSPFIHGMFAKQTGQNMTYTRMEVAPEDLSSQLTGFFADGGKGLNITVPHKQAACLLTRYRTPRAEIAGAVNTIAHREDGLLGDNTDGAGLIADLKRNLDVKLDGARILILGAGGAVRGVLGPLLAESPAYLEIANRNAERARQLTKEFATLGEIRGCGFEAIDTGEPFDLIVNATSASLHDSTPPVPSAAVAWKTLCYDMAYGKGDTTFTRWAKDAGAGKAETGWGMLVEQAAESFELWRGVKPQTAPVLAAVKSQQPPANTRS